MYIILFQIYTLINFVVTQVSDFTSALFPVYIQHLSQLITYYPNINCTVFAYNIECNAEFIHLQEIQCRKFIYSIHKI